MNRPVHKCSPIENHSEVDVFFRAGLVDMSQSGKSFPWCACAALLKKEKKHCSLFVAKKEWKKKEEKERLTKPLHICYISMHILHTVLHTFPKVLTRRIWLIVRS